MPEGIDGWIVHRTHTSFLSLLSTASISFPYLFVAPLSCPYPIAATWPTRCLHLSLPRCHDRQIARPTFLHFSHFLVFCTIIPFAVSFQKKWTLSSASSSLAPRFCVSAPIFLACICQTEGYGGTDVARTSAPRSTAPSNTPINNPFDRLFFVLISILQIRETQNHKYSLKREIST
jgi:hypothetical protein